MSQSSLAAAVPPGYGVTGGRYAKDLHVNLNQVRRQYTCGICHSVLDDGMQWMHPCSWAASHREIISGVRALQKNDVLAYWKPWTRCSVGLQRTCCHVGDWVVAPTDAGDRGTVQEAFQQTDTVDETLRPLAFIMFMASTLWQKTAIFTVWMTELLVMVTGQW